MTVKYDVEKSWQMLFHLPEAMRNTIARQERPAITLSQLRVLSCILYPPQHKVKVKDIANELNITSGGVSQLIDKLVAAGMVERKIDEDDRRAVGVELSTKGREMHDLFARSITDIFEKMMAPVPQSKRDTFYEVLETISKNLDRYKKQ